MTTNAFLIENVLAAAFDMPLQQTSAELDSLCEEGCTVIASASIAVEQLKQARDQLRSILQRMLDCDAGPGLRLAMLQVWKPALGQLEAALILLGER